MVRCFEFDVPEGKTFDAINIYCPYVDYNELPIDIRVYFDSGKKPKKAISSKNLIGKLHPDMASVDVPVVGDNVKSVKIMIDTKIITKIDIRPLYKSMPLPGVKVRAL